MKIKKIGLNTLWIYVFLLFFIFVPTIIGNEITVFAAMLAFILFAAYKFDFKKYYILIFFVAFIVRTAIVLIVKTPPISDFSCMLSAARYLNKGSTEFLEWDYFKNWPYQIGFVYFESLLLKIWDNILILQLFNCLFGSLTVLLVYFIAKEFCSEKASRAAALIYCFLPFPLFYVTVLTNQFLASFLIYSGIYILIAKHIKLNETIRCLIFSVLIVLANVARPESVIPLTAFLIFTVLSLNKTNFKIKLFNIVIVLAVYYGLFRLISYLFILSGISPQGLVNNAPLWKFVLGFNHDTGGSYSRTDAALYLTDRVKSLEIIKERILVSPLKLVSLFIEKIHKLWSGGKLNFTFGAFTESGLRIFGKKFAIADDCIMLEYVNKLFMLSIYASMISGIIKYIRNKNYNKNIILLITQIFVTLGVYLLIETQPRYVYHIQICAVMVAALGIDSFICFIKNKKSNQSN